MSPCGATDAPARLRITSRALPGLTRIGPSVRVSLAMPSPRMVTTGASSPSSAGRKRTRTVARSPGSSVPSGQRATSPRSVHFPPPSTVAESTSAPGTSIVMTTSSIGSSVVFSKVISAIATSPAVGVSGVTSIVGSTGGTCTTEVTVGDTADTVRPALAPVPVALAVLLTTKPSSTPRSTVTSKPAVVDAPGASVPAAKATEPPPSATVPPGPVSESGTSVVPAGTASVTRRASAASSPSLRVVTA